ncbi:DUF5011 domain-containing protein [[Clostridium] innocuum]|nr:DUF5011 domain-containing protein [[Clostridium] innocuum]
MDYPAHRCGGIFCIWRMAVQCKGLYGKGKRSKEITQLHINQNLLEHSFPQIIAQNQRIQQGMSFDIKTHVRAIDHQDGDISEKLEFYGSVNTQEKGMYTIRCVVRNSLGMKSVKHIQILVD